jgi:hypothetical protein
MKQKLKHDIKYLPVDTLHPYKHNARTHSGEQVDRIASSIQEFGFLNPILIDSASKTILAGHGRLLAAKKLGLETVPVVAFNHLTDAQRKAYTLADNKLALDAGWDYELLKIELDELKLEDFDLDMIGFGEFETQVDSILNPGHSSLGTPGTQTTPPIFEPNLPKESPYTQKTNRPLYEKTREEKPALETLYSFEKTKELLDEIESSDQDLSMQEKEFLKLAAYRHTVFNFEHIAEYYCHSNKKVQKLFENSALVIVDFDDGIKNGWIKLSKTLDEIYNEDFKLNELKIEKEKTEGLSDDDEY